MPMLSASVAQGNGAGTTSVSAVVSNPLNHLVVYGSDASIPVPNKGDIEPNSFTVILISPYTSGADIFSMDAVTNKYLVVYEAKTTGEIVQYKLFDLVAGDIKPLQVATITSDMSTLSESFITPGILNNGSIGLTLANSTFIGNSQDDVTNAITINNLPPGLTYTATLANSNKINVEITGSAIANEAIDSKAITITIDKSRINGAVNNISTGDIQINFMD
jgi:hypothetical protein